MAAPTPHGFGRFVGVLVVVGVLVAFTASAVGAAVDLRGLGLRFALSNPTSYPHSDTYCGSYSDLIASNIGAGTFGVQQLSAGDAGWTVMSPAPTSESGYVDFTDAAAVRADAFTYIENTTTGEHAVVEVDLANVVDKCAQPLVSGATYPLLAGASIVPDFAGGWHTGEQSCGSGSVTRLSRTSFVLDVHLLCQVAGEADELSFSPRPLPPAHLGKKYRAHITAPSGGIAPYTFTLKPGSAPLPKGLTLNGATGLVTGMPARGTAGTHAVSFCANDSADQTVCATRSIRVVK